MKLVACVVILATLVGCASNRQPQAMTYDQLSAIRVNNYQCKDTEAIVENMERQLKLRGLANVNPDDLTDADRMYNAKARIVIWSMRIGCNNPDRYKK